MKASFLTAVVLVCSHALSAIHAGENATPMIDYTHDRVQTTLDPQLKRIGTVTPRTAREVGLSKLAIGCEMLDRDYGNFESFKAYIEPLGIKRIRLQAGWAKTEKKKGEYDFAWLDSIVDYLNARGMDVMMETSYGNPIYPGGGGASLSDGLPTGDVALAAWDAWIAALAKHYKGRVKDWSTWNEPSNCKDNTPEKTADNNIRTAEIIKRYIPDARIAGLVISSPNARYAEPYMKVLSERGKAGLFEWIIYHTYAINPDSIFPKVEEFERTIHRYAPEMKIWQGESGAASDRHYSSALSSAAWASELTQCKWNARRLIGDLGHDIESLVFTFYDPAYDQPQRYTKYIDPLWIRTREDRFMKRMGLVKCNEDGKLLKVKPAYYTVQNIASVFDASLVADREFSCEVECAKELAVYRFTKQGSGQSVLAVWDCSSTPGNVNDTIPASITVRGIELEEPVWVDIVTGAIYELPDDYISTCGGRLVLKDIPVYDAPVLITEKSVVIE